MEERSFWSRFERLPIYMGCLVKETHAVIYASIASVTFFVISLIAPPILQHYGVASPSVSLPLALCGSVIVALLILGLAGYLVWEEEERQHARLKNDHAALQEQLKPRLRIEFDPQQPRFVSPIRTVGGINMRYIRVIVRALSPTVRECLAYLERISYLDGERYVTLFDEQLAMPWANEDPRTIVPRVLNRDVDALLDVAWLAEPARPGWLSALPPFGILNAQSDVPNSFDPVLQRILQNPTRNLKLDILVTGAESQSARLSLNIHRGAPQWDQAQIGWMDGLAIHHRDANF
jgi:hypothetical protein